MTAHPDAAPTEMLSVEEIDDTIKYMSIARNSPLGYICAMARRSAISEAAGKELALSADKLEKWREVARRDDWHYEIVGSDMRQLVEQSIQAIELQSKLAEVEAENARLKDAYAIVDTIRAQHHRNAIAAETRLREVTADRDALSELLWRLYEGLYGHRKAENIDYAKTAVGGALEVHKAWETRGRNAESKLTELSQQYDLLMFDRNTLVDRAQTAENSLTAANLRAETAWDRAKEACAKAVCKHCNAENTPKAGAHYLANEDHYVPCNSVAIHKLKEPANGNG